MLAYRTWKYRPRGFAIESYSASCFGHHFVRTRLVCATCDVKCGIEFVMASSADRTSSFEVDMVKDGDNGSFEDGDRRAYVFR